MVMRSRSALPVLLASLSLFAGTPAPAQVVGKAAAVNQDATVAGRALTIGANVIHKERIRTDGKGSLQLMFIDRTTITIGPNSDIVIDEYVFDPNRNAGRISVSVGKGLMRFVGGQISHSGEATVRTPPATIGIRGGIAIVAVENRSVSVTNAFGSVSVTANAGPAAGAPSFVPQGYTGTTNFSAPVSVTPTSQQQVGIQNQQFQSQPGQTGGVSRGTSASAPTVSNRNPTTTATITPATPPAAGSTASGPSSTASATPSSTSTSNSVSGGAPTAVTTTGQSVQTTSSTTAAQQSMPTQQPPKCDKGDGCGGGPGP
jgi:hypothetical protein